MQLIETYVPVTQVRGRLKELIEGIRERGDTVAITRNGIPEAVMLSYEHFDALIETMDILGDRDLMAQIERSKEDFKAGRWVEFDPERD